MSMYTTSKHTFIKTIRIGPPNTLVDGSRSSHRTLDLTTSLQQTYMNVTY